MSRTVLVVLALACTVAVWAAEPKADFFVSPNGSDQWSGKVAAPRAGRTDGPFATVQRAQQAVRALKAAQPDKPVTVMIAGGVYYLADPLTFTPADSGTDAAPVSYTAAPGEKPVLSGGVRLTGFKRTPEGRWQVGIPDVAQGNWTFCQLFVNGQRRYRPRMPKDTYYMIDGDVAADNGKPRFRFKAGQIRSDFNNLGDVEVLVFNNWTDSRMRVASVDDATHTVTFTGTSTFDMNKGRRFIVENVREALSQPGEWYLDNKTGILTYIPMPGEKLEDAVVIAPRIPQLVILKGDGALGQWVENLQFRGLTFAHSNWVLPPEGYSFGQAEAGLPGAISATGARNCVFDGCIVKQTGAWAIDLAGGCANNRIEDCDLVDLGAGGVKVGEMGIPADPKAAAQGNVVRNCTIAHGGRLHPAGIGIWVGQSPNNRFEHNEIWDLYYSGFSLGWTWGYGPSLAHDNTVEYNDVHQLGQQVLSDMGGIYTLGIETGTTIRFNKFHDVDYYYYGAWGIYFDEGSSNILAENNLVWNTHGGCLHQHYGENNRLINNIWAFDQSNQLARTRPEDHLSFTFEHNIVYARTGQMFSGNFTWTGHNYAFDYNLYWNELKEPLSFPAGAFEKWQADYHQDEHSLIADPMFVDPDHYNFALKPGSPAEQIGFKPFDLSTCGRRTKPHDPLSTQSVPRAFPGPPPPQPVADDFEDTPVGEKPGGATVSEENDTYTIRVTDETAASGKHCLKFITGPGQKYQFNPHMFYEPHFAKGVLEGSYDWRIEEGATPYQEWRQYPGGQYIVGPSIWITSDGWANSSDQHLFRVPYGKWMHFDIVVTVGPEAEGRWDLTVTWAGQDKPVVLKGLPCDPRFRALDWCGMSSNFTVAAHFYWDNVKVGPRAGH